MPPPCLLFPLLQGFCEAGQRCHHALQGLAFLWLALTCPLPRSATSPAPAEADSDEGKESGSQEFVAKPEEQAVA